MKKDSRFNGQLFADICFVIDKKAYNDYIKESKRVGRKEGGQFVTAYKHIKGLNTPADIEKRLSFTEAKDVYYVYRMKPIYALILFWNLKFPERTNEGSNAEYIEGGWTKGGAIERIIPRTPLRYWYRHKRITK